jgi:ribosome biogenesis GTPase
MSLEEWGWTEAWAAEAPPCRRGELGRIVGQERDRWSIQTQHGIGAARLPTADRLERYPVVGDWVEVVPGPMPSDPWSIVEVLPRRSAFSRGVAGGESSEQVLAANIDLVWLVHGLDSPINPRRLERYLAVAWESGALPEIVLTKSDLATELDAVVAEAKRLAVGVEVRVVSVVDPESIERLRSGLARGQTVALLGPSGAGKSTLINALSGMTVAETGPVRERDRKGRHTTTRRELFQLSNGALLVDTPGLRELRVWELDEGLDLAFPEIEALGRSCRFRDCRHQVEPGCAVLEAADLGRLDPERLASYRKLQAEASFQARRADPLLRAADLSRFKTAMKTLKHHHPKYNPPADSG